MKRVVRAIRGAIQVRANTPEDIESATRELVEAMAACNELAPEDVISALFTATPDLDAQFPAVGARRAGWTEVALACAQEMAVPFAPPRIVRALVHAYVPPDRTLHHVYLGGARVLRPDWATRS